MALIVSLLSTLILGIGVMGLVSPGGMRSLVARFRTSTGFSTALALRLLFGVALWRAAPASRAPVAFQVFGIVTAASAFALLALGIRRYRALLSWWSGQSDLVVRVWSAGVGLVGALILWAVR